MKIFKKLFTSLLLLLLIIGCSPEVQDNLNLIQSNDVSRATTYADNMAPSQDPPGGLLPTEVPQFVILSYDDNQFADGMHNVMNIVKNKYNPAGTGAKSTFDGTRLTGTYFMNPAGHNDTDEWSIDGATANSWTTAYLRGNEIGNHTYYHDHGLGFNQAKWLDEITRCHDFLVERCNIPSTEIIGFRTPFLEYSTSTMAAVKQYGYTYDSSFEGGWRNPEDGSTLYWPYTLDNGIPFGEAGRNPGTHAGLWELPIDCIFYSGGKTTGFDYNLWFSLSMTKSAYVNALKYSFDKKYNGNRSPMNVGLHSNYYSDDAIEEMKIYDPGSLTKLRSTVTERIEAMEEFVNYALTHPDVRFVSAAKMLEWLRNPVALGGTADARVSISTVIGPNGSVDPAGGASGSFQVYSGEDVTFIIQPDHGYKTSSVTVDGVLLDKMAYAGNKYTLTNVTSAHSIEVTFEAYPPGEEYTLTYYWTFDPEIEPVEPSGVMVDLLTMEGTVIATVDENLAKRYAMEGSGFLPDRRLINLKNADDWPLSRFIEVDKNYAPWGLDAQEGPLVPWETIAVDPNVIPLGTPVYIAEFDGVLMPDNTLHDGWFVARDTSHSFSGKWIDVFAKTYDEYMYMEGILGGIETCTVTLGQVETKPITASSGPNGIISPTGVVDVPVGANKTFKMIPAVGYAVDTVTVDGVLQNPAPTEYTFVDVQGPHTIEATFYKLPDVYYGITATAGPGGSISPSGTVSVLQFTDQAFTFAPAAEMMVDTVTVDGIVQDPTPSSYTFTSVQADHTIDVTFKPAPTCDLPDWDPTEVYHGGAQVHWDGADWEARWWSQGDEPGTTGEWGVWKWLRDCGSVVTHTVTITAGPGGSVSPSGTVQVPSGSVIAPVVNPDTGYVVEDIKIDNVSVGTTMPVIPPVDRDMSIHVTFRPDGPVPEYTITITAGPGGTTSPVGAVVVLEGGSLTVTFNPDTGFGVDQVTVDGTPDPAKSSYTFNDVRADHTLNVTFTDVVLPQPWAEGVYYELNDEVSHDGKVWVCKYAHTSNSAWVPGTPGLWLWEEKV